MASLENLPEEVMIEILSRIPPESLLRFECVRKSWYALINDPKFATKHFYNSLQHKHVLLKRLVTKNSDKNQMILSFLKFPHALDRSVSVFDVDLPFDDDSLYFEICGHSHGLLCLTDLDRDIFLCNPATREFRKLPPSILLLTEPPIEPDGYDSFTKAVGFGYDSKSRDFKVVRVVDFVEGPDYFYPPRVEIYNLSKDGWREIETPVCGHVFWAPSFGMYHEGKYYWWAGKYYWWADAEGGAEIIQSFDMSEEVFGGIPVPESFEEQRERHRSMGVLNGSIVLFHYPGDERSLDERSFDIWGMEKDESGGISWSKILTIGPVSGIEMPLVFVSSEQLLMEANEGQLILYNIKTQQFKELPVKGHPAEFQATPFVKSLLTVKGGNNITYGF